MKVRDAFNAAVREAVKEGRINRKKHGAIIEAGRKVAGVMDEKDWPIVRGKIDNVSPGVFLKYCEALGLTVDVKKPDQKSEPSEREIKLVGNSKWKRQA